MDRGAWWATVHRVAELDAIEQLSTHACIPCTLRLLFWIFYPARVCEKRGQEHPAVTCPGSDACILTAFHWLEPRPMASCNCKRDWETYLAICPRRGNKIRWTVDIYCHRRWPRHCKCHFCLHPVGLKLFMATSSCKRGWFCKTDILWIFKTMIVLTLRINFGEELACPLLKFPHLTPTNVG